MNADSMDIVVARYNVFVFNGSTALPDLCLDQQIVYFHLCVSLIHSARYPPPSHAPHPPLSFRICGTPLLRLRAVVVYECWTAWHGDTNEKLVRSRNGVHVNELLCELDFNAFFEKQKAWRTNGDKTQRVA